MGKSTTPPLLRKCCIPTVKIGEEANFFYRKKAWVVTYRSNASANLFSFISVEMSGDDPRIRADCKRREMKEYRSCPSKRCKKGSVSTAKTIMSFNRNTRDTQEEKQRGISPQNVQNRDTTLGSLSSQI